MSAHTPGPWHVICQSNGVSVKIGERGIALFRWDKDDADALLIAAAPELLQALELFIAEGNEPSINGRHDGYSRPRHPQWRVALHAARAAIAKAKGEDK